MKLKWNLPKIWIMMKNQGAVSIRKTVLPGMAIPMLKIRRPNGRLIFNMEIARGHGDLEHPQAQYFSGENYVCICTYVYMSLKSQNHTESSILKKKIYSLHCQKYICVFFVIIVNWMIIFLTKVRLNIWRLSHCPLEDVALILCI